MRFVVEKSTTGDYYVIWNNELKCYYGFGGILMRGSKVEMDKTAADLNQIHFAHQKMTF